MKRVCKTLAAVTIVFTSFSYALGPSLCEDCIGTSKKICLAHKQKCTITPEALCSKICPPGK